MANVGVSSIKLIDSDGDALDDGAGKLNVNATLVAGATIDIGDVDLFLDGGTALVGGAGTVASGVLRVTLASDDPAVVDLAAMEVLLGTIDADTGSIRSTLGDMIEAVYVDDADWTDGASRHMLVGGLYQSSMQTVTDGDVAPFQVDSNGVLKVLGKTEGYRSISHGSNTDVGTSAEALSSSQACKHVDIMAAIANTGIIYVGGSGVTAATGIALYAGDTYSVNINNLDSIYVLASVNGEDVQWVYYE